MPFRLWRGYNRLFLVFAILWAICCAVLYPLQRQFDGQEKAILQNDREMKVCQQLIVQPGGGYQVMADCIKRTDAEMYNALARYSYSNFWIFDVAFWQLEALVIIVPPLIVYSLAVACRWIWRGFTS